MSNNTANLNQQKYTKETQALLEEKLVSFVLANTRLISRMPDGNTINFPRPNYNAVDEYTKYNDVTDDSIDYDNEQLVINQTPIISFTLDVIDEQDSAWEIAMNETKRNAYLLQEKIDWDFFNEYSNADNQNDSVVALSTSNVVSTYGKAFATLANNWVDVWNLCLAVDPFQRDIIWQGSLGNTFNVADSVYKNWYVGDFQWMQAYISTNLTAEWVLNLATNPTDWDKVTINWVVFTFKDTLWSEPGNVKIEAGVADTRENLVDAINNTGVATDRYVPVAQKERNNKLRGLSVEEASATVVLTSKRGYKPVSSDLTENDDKWWAITIHNIAMEKGSIHMVLRNAPMLKVQDVPKQLAERYMVWTRYWIKTFSEWAERMYDIRIEAQPAE